MGLDAVEIVMAIEDAFRITVPDEEWTRARTPRDIIALVLARVGESPHEAACLSMRSFHSLKRGFEQLHPERGIRIRTSTPLRNLLPSGPADAAWRKWQRYSGINSFPPLSRSVWIQTLCWFAAAMAGFFAYSAFKSLSAGIVFAGLTGPAMFFITSRTKRTSFTHMPVRTVGDLADYIVINAPSGIRGSEKHWSRAEVRTVVRKIIGSALHVKKFSDDADIVWDLGAT